MVAFEPDVLIGRRAFPTAQRLFAGEMVRRVSRLVDVGWYGTETDPEAGAFAVVRDGGGLDDLIGEVVKVIAGKRSAYVYVLGARGVPADLALSRRAFLALGRLSHESLPCVGEVVA